MFQLFLFVVAKFWVLFWFGVLYFGDNILNDQIDYDLNIEGNFIAKNIPEISSIVIDKNCTEEVLYDVLDENQDATHIGLTAYAIGINNAIKIIKIIQNEYSHLELYVGGVGAAYPNIQELIPKNNLCIGEGVNFLRKKFGLKLLTPQQFKIPEIIGNLSEFPIPIKTAYMVTQLGCPNFCDFCITPRFFNKYFPEVGVSRHPIIFINVDFPDPEGPMIATYSFLLILIVIDLKALTI